MDAAVSGVCLAGKRDELAFVVEPLTSRAAIGAAFSSMAGNSAVAGTGASNRLVVGVGAYGGETALSVGYARSISRRTAINAGVSFTGGELMSGGSCGFAW